MKNERGGWRRGSVSGKTRGSDSGGVEVSGGVAVYSNPDFFIRQVVN